MLQSCWYNGSQCGVRDPSWSELRHFIGFLDTQLRNCENSIFCNENIVGDVMSGLKTFVVKFMIRMSKVMTMTIYIVNFFLILLGLCHFLIERWSSYREWGNNCWSWTTWGISNWYEKKMGTKVNRLTITITLKISCFLF